MFESRSSLTQHYVSHFAKELKERFPILPSDTQCSLCNRSLPSVKKSQFWMMHIGSTHGKVKDIMVEKGLRTAEDVFTKSVAKRKFKEEAIEVKQEARDIEQENVESEHDEINDLLKAMAEVVEDLHDNMENN